MVLANQNAKLTGLPRLSLVLTLKPWERGWFSAQHGVNAESDFTKYHRKRVASRRIDDTPENTVHFGLQTFYRKEFLQVLGAQILLLEDNLKVAFKII